MNDFLAQFTFGGLLAYGIGAPENLQYTDTIPIVPLDKDVYFGPAMRQTKGRTKANVLGSKVLWVDADDPAKPFATFPPSMQVFSGHGWHMYWILDDPVLDTDYLESLNKILEADVPTADKGCWNCNRVLRIPGTTNLKYPDEPVTVELTIFRPDLTYTRADFEVLEKLGSRTRHKIRTGDARGFRSRSERDWSIVTALVGSGATDELIVRLFDHQPCGDKHAENTQYLPRTIEKIRAKVVQQAAQKAAIQEQEDGYYAPTTKGLRRISTFTIDPVVLLDGSAFGEQDVIVGTVTANSFSWYDVPFTRMAFTTTSRMDKECPVAAWQFLGREADVRLLLPYLLDKLQEKGLPRVAATPTMGLHTIEGKMLFLGDKHVISAEQVWEGYNGPLSWLPAKREHPEMAFQEDPHTAIVEKASELVPLLNEPGTIWPMIGWYSASCLKPWIEAHRYRFPILSVVGTKGSGKTTLIQRVFMPLFGQADPKTYDSNTTRFVTLALLGSTNAIPVAFSEFRYGIAEKFIRYVLLSYDTGHDPRGRPDQTTVDYPLSAPFSLDGEDLIDDPAARERILVAHLHPDAVREHGPAYNAFQELRRIIEPSFGRMFVQRVLQLEPQLEALIQRAEEAVFEAFPKRMPDRVRKNHVVAYFGMLLWAEILQVSIPTAEVLKDSIQSVFDFEAGRSRTLADTMVEDIVNSVVQSVAYFNHAYDNTSNILWFQLAPTHTWWISSRRRQGRNSLERDALRAQLREAPYIVSPQVVRDAWMYGIDLVKAVELGLDIPNRISDRQFVVRLNT